MRLKASAIVGRRSAPSLPVSSRAVRGLACKGWPVLCGEGLPRLDLAASKGRPARVAGGVLARHCSRSGGAPLGAPAAAAAAAGWCPPVLDAAGLGLRAVRAGASDSKGGSSFTGLMKSACSLAITCCLFWSIWAMSSASSACFFHNLRKGPSVLLWVEQRLFKGSRRVVWRFKENRLKEPAFQQPRGLVEELALGCLRP